MSRVVMGKKESAARRRKRRAAALLAATMLVAVSARGDDLPSVAVAGAESPGAYKHPASITELRGGELLVVYYGGEGEYARDTAVWGTRGPADGSRWSKPEKVADTPFRSEGNAVVWEAPDGVVWLFWVTRYGETWSTSRIKARFSRDGARTWSDPLLVSLVEGLMVRNRPLPLEGGDFLLPVYHERGDDREAVGAESVSQVVRYRSSTHEWELGGAIRSREGNVQPAVVRRRDGSLLAFCRRGGGYGPGTRGFIVRSTSTDGGRTWSPGVDSELPNPNAAVDLLRLRSGRLLVVYNHSMVDRTPLTAALSDDDGESFPHSRDIATGPGPYAYPYAIEARDGRVLVVFTTRERTEVRLLTLRERDLVGRRRDEPGGER